MGRGTTGTINGRLLLMMIASMIEPGGRLELLEEASGVSAFCPDLELFTIGRISQNLFLVLLELKEDLSSLQHSNNP